MNNILTASPTPKSVTTDVPTIEWIDNHADKDKIWALVVKVRNESYKEGIDHGWADARDVYESWKR